MNANRKRNINILVFSAALAVGAAVATAVRADADTAGIQQAGALMGVPAALLKPSPKPATIVLSGFSKQRINGALSAAEGIMFNGHIGTIKAACGGVKVPVSQSAPLYKTDAMLVQSCPGRDLVVTMTSHLFHP